MSIEKDFAANSGRISGGVGWSIQFNTPDCQHGWSVVKEGTGQSIGCYFKEEDAQEALAALAVTEPVVNKKEDSDNDIDEVSHQTRDQLSMNKDDVNGQTKQDEQEGIGSLSFWNGSFAPVFGNQKVQYSWMSTYNTPPQNDGKPSVGYGNHSDPKGRSNS
jgi:hypothetical protein